MAVTGDTLVKSSLTLKGSAEIIVEFFDYGINSILYQRGIYPPESFTRMQKYGLTLLVSTDKAVKEFLKNVLDNIKEWILKSKVSRLALVISSVDTKENLERWDFNIECESKAEGSNEKEKPKKDLKEIQKEIQDVIRQITASVTFLPLLSCPCSFDLLIYTDKDLEIPDAWSENEPCFIPNAEEVKFRSFSTSMHKVQTAVSYSVN